MDWIGQLDLFEEEILRLRSELKVLESKAKDMRSAFYRDMADRWQSGKDLVVHPVTGGLHPLEAEQILFEQVAKKCRGK